MQRLGTNRRHARRALALLGSAAAVLVLSSQAAEAQQVGPTPLTVSTTISGACTAVLVGGNINFGAYVTGTSSNLNGTTTFDITCPTSSFVAPQPVTMQFNPVLTGTAVGFEMSKGAAGAAPFLTYKLCDTSCTSGTVYGVNVAGPQISVNAGASAQTYTLFAQIPSGQNPTASATAYSQQVNAYVNY
jgi:hypothetical protein